MKFDERTIERREKEEAVDRIDHDRAVSAVSSLAYYPPFVHDQTVRGKVSHGFACDRARNESWSAESVDFRSELVRVERIAIVERR